MRPVPGLILPSYYRYYASPVKIVASSDGGIRVWRVSIDTGGWRQENEIFEEIAFAVGGEIFTLSPDRFVQEVEAYRGRHLSGKGPIFALYETVDAIIGAEAREGRRLTEREQALVRGIRRKTFVLFEEQLQQGGDPGADPTIAAP
ncbi:hypothetical protein [Micromonospora sp. NPDC001898]|uniref:hypothetical protein n=1 Tax=Micromonospora sp. NPDC001898 TaxID=3364221 RepID=UPI0036C5B121